MWRAIVWGIAVLSLAGCATEVQSGLDENQADAIVVALHRAGIGATKDAQGRGDDARYAVSVLDEDVAQALNVLQEEHLPGRPEPGLHDLFGEGGLVPTATEERARYIAALSGELSRSLESIDGVLDARVHVALPERRDFQLDEQADRPRASVLLEVDPAVTLDTASVEALVSGAVSGMRADDVAVVSMPRRSSRAAGLDLVQLGPIAVTRGSAPTLKWVLVVALLVDIVLAGLLLWLLFRHRRAGRGLPV